LDCCLKCKINFKPEYDNCSITLDEKFCRFDNSFWQLRDDTFPSSLALFDPSNFVLTDEGATLNVYKKNSGVRKYTATSICSRQKFLYGCFEAQIKPSNVSGVITGVFLHRNSPRQEIDIEFPGKDTTKILLNVYYNPGSDGAMFDYGYRGTPVLLDLGFDASEAFHSYKIDWSPTSIKWFVDGRLVHERFNWDPTPIPHLPMQFHVNSWISRSVELVGKILDYKLPASSSIKAIHLNTFGEKEGI
jgi:beta-glucanase (GH16 family)